MTTNCIRQIIHGPSPPLKNDPTMTALARVIAEQLQGTVRQIGKNIIYARIDELDEQTLDVLAYDLHVDWYDYSYPIEVKRRTIRDSVRVHRRLGTKYAVETALGRYSPERGCKSGSSTAENRTCSKSSSARRNRGYRRTGKRRFWSRCVFIKTCGPIWKQSVIRLRKKRQYSRRRSIPSACGWKFTYLAEDIEETARIKAGAGHTVGVRVDIYPHVYRKMGADWRALCAYIQQTGKLEIFPAEQNGGVTMAEIENKYGSIVTDVGVQLITEAVMEGRKSILQPSPWATAAEATTSRIPP